MSPAIIRAADESLHATMPDGWTLHRLKDVLVGSQYGLTVPFAPDGEIPIVGMKDLNDGKVCLDDLARIHMNGREIEPYRLKRGDILLNRTNSPDLVGKIGMVEEESGAVFASYLVRLVADEDVVTPEFLNAWLNTDAVRRVVDRVATRAVSQANVNPTRFVNECFVPVPPINEQRRIMEVLRPWSTAISIICRLRDARLRAIHGDGRRLLQLHDTNVPDEWRTGVIGDVVAAITTGVSVSAEDRSCEEHEVGVLKTTSVLTGIFEPHQHKAVVPAEAHLVSAPVTGDTVLVSRMNTADLVGRSAYVPADHPTLFLPDRLWQVRAKPEFPARWLAAVIGNPAFRPRLAAITAGTSGSMKNISQGDFLALSIPIPPANVRERLALLFEAFEHEVDLLRQQEAKLRTQKAALMARLLSGQLRVSEATHEAHIGGGEMAHV